MRTRRRRTIWPGMFCLSAGASQAGAQRRAHRRRADAADSDLVRRLSVNFTLLTTASGGLLSNYLITNASIPLARLMPVAYEPDEFVTPGDSEIAGGRHADSDRSDSDCDRSGFRGARRRGTFDRPGPGR